MEKIISKLFVDIGEAERASPGWGLPFGLAVAAIRAEYGEVPLADIRRALDWLIGHGWADYNGLEIRLTPKGRGLWAFTRRLAEEICAQVG